jgi:hypothetical protein
MTESDVKERVSLPILVNCVASLCRMYRSRLRKDCWDQTDGP